MALVYYPTVAAFIDMMTSADYETDAIRIAAMAAPSTSSSATNEAYSKFKTVGQAVL